MKHGNDMSLKKNMVRVVTLCCLFIMLGVQRKVSAANNLQSASFASDKVTVQVGKTVNVAINVKPAGAEYYVSSWSIDSTGIVKAEFAGDDSSLKLKALSVGTTHITIKISDFANHTFSSKLTVTVTGTKVKKRTKKQIRAFIKKSKVTTKAKVSYKKKPKASYPYKAGELSAKTQKSALKMMNNIRYIAGLDANVKLDSKYTKLAQAASLVNAANNELSHFPGKPSKMSESLYETGYEGAGSSNIAMGFDNLNDALVNGWMSDGDSYNIDRVGHRRWVLNPPLAKVGFGAVNRYMAMYAFDQSGKGTQSMVYWPAQTMPLAYFDNNDPWSVSTGQILDKKKIKVTMTRLSDKKKWTFSAKSKSGYFNVDNANYGQTGCIIFRPKNIKYKSGNKFKVKITGIPTGTVTYTVTFFKL
ncbi:MAG: CAP domain-containing protein [Lachnospiraceae bacterium]|nr:CAP domain-containing protein [Lachnospiraceae bacterium]